MHIVYMSYKTEALKLFAQSAKIHMNDDILVEMRSIINWSSMIIRLF